MSPRRVTPKMQSPLYGRIRQILESDTSPRKSLGLNISDALRRKSLTLYAPRGESWVEQLTYLLFLDVATRATRVGPEDGIGR
jgi:hypothetical protein